MAALWLIQRAGQLDNVLNGDFMTATNNLGGVWASLHHHLMRSRNAARLKWSRIIYRITAASVALRHIPHQQTDQNHQHLSALPRM
nr:hypothetical protein [Pectobacterium brasiliense]